MYSNQAQKQLHGMDAFRARTTFVAAVVVMLTLSTGKSID